MSTRIKGKAVALAVVIVASMVVMGVLLNAMQERLQLSNCRAEIAQQAGELPELLQAAADETAQNEQNFDAIFQSKVEAVAFMAQNDVGFEATDAKMRELQELLNVDNIMVVTREGEVVAKAQETNAEFSYQRFNELRTTFETGKASDAVEIELPDQEWVARYYACSLGGQTMIVVENSPEELRELVETTGSDASVLKNITIGSGGYVMAISTKDYLVTYSPDESVVGTDVLEDGIDAADLEDGNFFHAEFNGEALYCGVSQIDDAYYVFAVPEDSLLSSRFLTVGVILFVFLGVMLAVALYGLFVLGEDERSGASVRTAAFGRYCYNSTVGKKAVVLSVVGFLAVVGVTFYMQTLFALSGQAVTNAQRAAEVSETIALNEQRADELEGQYAERYLNKCHVAAYIIEQNPALASREKLAELKDILQVASIYVYDGDGGMTASSTSQRSYRLSETYGDSSYEFRSLLGGTDEYVQDLSVNATTGEVAQWMGVALYDEAGLASGIVQIGVRPMRLETLLESVAIDHVLDGVKVGSEGFAFALNKDEGATVASYPNEKLLGKAAEEIGLTEDQVKDGFSDYITVDGELYFANCTELSDCYLFVAGPEGELMAERAPLSAATGAIALVCLLLVFLVLSLESVPSAAPRARAEGETEGQARAGRGRDDAGEAARMVNVTLADGRTKRTESAVSRWLNRSIGWHEKSPEQKLATVIRFLVGVAAFAVCLAVVFKDRLFTGTSVFAYILDGGWERGVNIFAITASIMYACVAITVAAVLQWLLHLLAVALGTRGETVCRLLSSVVKYGMVIFMLYWCLGVLGVDTATLLASMGIITLALSFGAKDLITDILSGLFIIFEGEFRVGDIIQVGGNTGTVMEIGVRTTKIKNGAGDVLVLRNSGISNVTNKTKLDSYANVDVVIPVGENLPYVENVLAAELPTLRERVPEILKGPFYKGVVDLSDSSMTIRVVATCAESDRAALERSLKREMKLLLSRNDIAPYQVAFDHEEALQRSEEESLQDAEELRWADYFNEEQAEAARNVGNESGSK